MSTGNYGGFGHVNGVNYIQCCKCQKSHFEDEPLYKAHIGFQSKHGIFQMSRQDFDRMRETTPPDTTQPDAAPAAEEDDRDAIKRLNLRASPFIERGRVVAAEVEAALRRSGGRIPAADADLIQNLMVLSAAVAFEVGTRLALPSELRPRPSLESLIFDEGGDSPSTALRLSVEDEEANRAVRFAGAAQAQDGTTEIFSRGAVGEGGEQEGGGDDAA